MVYLNKRLPITFGLLKNGKFYFKTVAWGIKKVV